MIKDPTQTKNEHEKVVQHRLLSLFTFVKSVSFNHYYQCILSRPCVYIVNDNVTVIFIVSNMHCNFHYVTFMYSKGHNIKSVLRILK